MRVPQAIITRLFTRGKHSYLWAPVQVLATGLSLAIPRIFERFQFGQKKVEIDLRLSPV